MKKCVFKINSLQASKYTNFKASYGAVVVCNSCVQLFLDKRYLAKAKAQKEEAYELNQLPKQGLIFDAWEWTIAEFQRFGFENYSFANDWYSNEDNFEPPNDISFFDYNKRYLLSNLLNAQGPCFAFVLENREIKKESLEHLKDVCFDPEITPIYFLQYLDLDNAIDDPLKINQAVVADYSGYKNFLKKEAIAWCIFWQELEENFQNYTEQTAASEFLKIRKDVHKESLKNSFDPIFGYGFNSQYIHYEPGDIELGDGILLVDAGGKTGDFISDITRVFYLGKKTPDYETKKAYTDVLKAHIAFATYQLGKNETVNNLDKVTRQYVDYPHAAGHGVGRKNVHVFPAISPNSKALLQNRMVITNEPGYYSNKFGIRLESMLFSILNGNFFTFEYLTYVPFEKKLILYDKLSQKEIEWLSNFNKICYEELVEDVNIDFLRRKLKER